jgi:hypothetical protein
MFLFKRFWCIDLNSCISLNYNIASQYFEDVYITTKIVLAYVFKTTDNFNDGNLY